MKPGHDCHGCQGIQPITPRTIHNRAGLEEIDYRVGTHAGFLETMLARIAELASIDELTPAELHRSHANAAKRKPKGLSQLTSRDLDDPSIAILDSWSLIADVLSFYQERYQNEAYLRTSVERRSIQQLAILVGYKLRPGLSSSVYLAFTVDDSASEVIIPAGTQAKSTPSPDSTAGSQTFETSEEFLARPLWNEIRPRLTMPHDFSNPSSMPRLYLNGTGLRIGKNNRVGIQANPSSETVVGRVASVEELGERKLTIVTLQKMPDEGEKLIDAVEAVLNRYLTGEALESVKLVPSDIKNEVAEILSAARAKSSYGEFEQVDEIIANTLVLDYLNQSLATRVQSNNDSLKKIKEIVGEYIPPKLDYGKSYDDIKKDFKQKHKQIQADYAGSFTDLPSIYKKVLEISKSETSVQYFSAGSSQASVDARPFSNLKIIVPALSAPAPRGRIAFVVRATHEFGEAIEDSEDSAKLVDKDGNPIKAIVAELDPPDALAVALARIEIKKQVGGSICLEIYHTTSSTHGTSVANVREHWDAIGYAHETLSQTSSLATAKVTPFAALPISETNSSMSRSLTEITKISAQKIRVRARIVEPDVEWNVRWYDSWDEDRNEASTFDLTPTVEVNRRLRELKPNSDSSPLLVDFDFVDDSENTIGFVRRHFLPCENAEFALLQTFALQMQKLAGAQLEFEKTIGALEGIANDDSGTLSSLAKQSSELRLINLVESDLAVKLKKLSNKLKSYGHLSVCPPDIRGEIEAYLDEIRNFQPDKYVDTVPHLETCLKAIVTYLKAYLDKHLFLSDAESEIVQLVRGEFEGILRARIYGEGKLNGKNIDEAIDSPKFAEVASKIKSEFADPILQLHVSSVSFFISDMILGLNMTGEDWETIVELVRAHAQAGLTENLYQKLLKKLATVTNSELKLLPIDSVVENFFAIDALDSQLINLLMPFVLLVGSAKSSKYGRLQFKRELEELFVASMPPTVKAFIDSTKELETHGSLPDRSITIKSTLAKVKVNLRAPDAFTLLGAARITKFKTAIGGMTSFTPIPRKGGFRDLVSRLQLGGNTLGRIDLNALIGSKDTNLISQIQSILDTSDQATFFDGLRRYRNNEEARRPTVTIFRSIASLYGWNSPGIIKSKTGTEETITPYIVKGGTTFYRNHPIDESSKVIHLDGEYSNTARDCNIAFDDPDSTGKTIAKNIIDVAIKPRTAYGISNKATRITLADNGFWRSDMPDWTRIRSGRVWCDEEKLDLAEVPLDLEPLGDLYLGDVVEASNTIELDQAHPELNIGSTIIIEGFPKESNVERTGVKADRQIFKITNISHDDTVGKNVRLFGDRVRTTLTLNNPIERPLLRSTVKIYANVVEATHGGKLVDVLGGGDGRKRFQEFALKDGPLSRVPADTELGHRDELEVRVNKVKWDQAERISDSAPEETSFELVSTLDESHGIRFGDGENAARLPSGNENVRSAYRVGMGLDGNVQRDRINQLPAPPYGLKAVRNPIHAAGGADKDSVFQSRYRTSLAAASMQRLVSFKDYENFAVMFAGVDKAKVTYAGDSIVVNIAGPSYESLPEESVLLRNLESAMTKLSDGELSISVKPHKNMLLFIFAGVKIDDRYLWEEVHAEIRQVLLVQFGYSRAGFDTKVHSSDVIATMQAVEGVVYVDLDAFAGILETDVRPEPESQEGDRQAGAGVAQENAETEPEHRDQLSNRASSVSEIEVSGNVLCFLTPDIPNTLRIERR